MCKDIYHSAQGVTKRCRLSWLTNGALVYEPKSGGKLRGLGQCVQLYKGDQINFGDLTPYWTYMIPRKEQLMKVADMSYIFVSHFRGRLLVYPNQTVTQTQLHSPPRFPVPTSLHRLIHIQSQILTFFASFKDVHSYSFYFVLHLATYKGNALFLDSSNVWKLKC